MLQQLHQVVVLIQILVMIVLGIVWGSDFDGICDELEVIGCSDFLALNFNPYSTDDGVCEYLGCTDSLF